MVSTAFLSSLIVLGISGIIISLFIASKHIKKQPLVCPIGNDCTAVIESKWSHTLGIRNEYLGILYYLFVIIMAFLIFKEYNYELFLLIVSSGALVFSSFLVYVQAKILKNYCFYCLLSSLVNLLIFINSIAVFTY